jgi:ABC-type ATPase involved in cell division
MPAFPPSEGPLYARACAGAVLRALPSGPNVFLVGRRQAGETSVLRLLAAARLEAGEVRLGGCRVRFVPAFALGE